MSGMSNKKSLPEKRRRRSIIAFVAVVPVLVREAHGSGCHEASGVAASTLPATGI